MRKDEVSQLNLDVRSMGRGVILYPDHEAEITIQMENQNLMSSYTRPFIVCRLPCGSIPSPL